MTTETGFAERLVTRLARMTNRRPSRRSMIAAATLSGAALAVDPWGYLTRPQSAYGSVCGPGASCDDGWSVMCCSINDGHNTCPPNTYPGGWWKADRSSFCGGAARYYIDCNAKPGHHFQCHCHQGSCDHRYVACNHFRYGQCNTQVKGVTPVVCRQISCLPPWQLYPGDCGHSSATDNNTAKHNAPCLTKDNTYPRNLTFTPGHASLAAGHYLPSGQRITSPDRHTEAVMQTDGNFVIRNARGVVWQTHTAGKAKGGRLYLSQDGRLYLVDIHGQAQWRTHPSREQGDPVLRVRNDGRLTINTEHKLIWQTGPHPK